MEAEALRVGLLIAIHQGWDDIELECDCSVLVTAITRTGDDLSDIGRIVEDYESPVIIQDVLYEDIRNASIVTRNPGDHDHHIPGHVPALSPHGAARVYAPPYVVSTVRSARHVGGEWSSGLCHCCDDPANCLITLFCPCITFGQIAEIVDQGSSSCAQKGTCYGILLSTTGLACLYSCFYRSKLRGQYDLEEAPCVDCLVHFCCATCALCQEYRELRSRGFDMGIGWEANLDRQRRGVTQAPTVAPGMTR